MKQVIQTTLFLIFPLFLFAQPCFITFTFNGGLVCSDNGTPGDPSDDTYTAQVNVTGNNLGNNGWIASDALSSTGPYNQIVTIGPYLISDGIFNLSFQDADDPSCNSAAVQITPPQPCSNAVVCDITDPGIGAITCNDFGTSNPNDDFAVIELNPTGTGLGTSYFVTSVFTSPSPGFANYGVTTPQDLFFATAPNPTITLNIIDVDDPNCSLTFTIDNPCFTTSTCDLTNPGLGLERQLGPDGGTAIEQIQKIPGPVLLETQKMMKQYLSQGKNPNLSAWLTAVDHTTSRMGLLVCGDLHQAANSIKNDSNPVGKATVKDKIRELVLFAISDEYFELRTRLGLSIDNQ